MASFKRTSLAACLTLSGVMGQHPSFPRFTLAMAPFEGQFKWEPVEMTTSDGYILTSFVVSQLSEELNVNPPVIVHHGNGWDAASWMMSLQQSDSSKGTPIPFIFDIVRKGHPVWLMN